MDSKLEEKNPTKKRKHFFGSLRLKKYARTQFEKTAISRLMRVFASANKFDDYWLVLMFSCVEEADLIEHEQV